MEKLRINSKLRLFKRLLNNCSNNFFSKSSFQTKKFSFIIFFSILTITKIFSQNSLPKQDFLPKNQTSQYEFTADSDQTFFPNKDIYFTLKIPEKKSSDIEIIFPSKQPNISITYSKKNDDLFQNQTIIQVSLNFFEEGIYHPENLILQIKNQTETFQYTAAFPEINIVTDAAIQTPKIFIYLEENNTPLFSNSKEDFDKIEKNLPLSSQKQNMPFAFSIYIQYAKKILSFDYDIPQNSILTKTFQSDFEQLNQDTISDSLKHIASFEFTELLDGLHNFPTFSITVTNNQDNTILLTSQEFSIFYDKNFQNNENNTNSYFRNAFEIKNFPEQKEIQSQITYDSCKQKFNKIYKNHIIFCIFLLFFLFLFFVLLCFVFNKFFIKKHVINKFIFITLSFFLSFFITLYFLLSFNISIYTGGKIYSIPHKNASNSKEIPMGSTVKILQKSQTWYLIEYSEENNSQQGWCQQEQLLFK